MGEQSIEMDPEVAKTLLVEGATFVFLDVPVGTEFGIDLKTWNTAGKFRGIKMIPPGLHMIHFSATGKYGDVAPKVSFLHNFKRQEFLVKKWDIDSETISSECMIEEDVKRLRSNLLNLDKYLGPYPYDIWKKWQKLSGDISDDMIKALRPDCGLIRSALEFTSLGTPEPRLRRSKTAEEREEELLPHLTPTPGTQVRVTPIPTRGFPEGASPQDITKHSLDPSFMLNSMIESSSERGCNLIGELQFSFICFLVGQSLESLEHWKSLIVLLCKCQSAVIRHRELYFKFLSCIETQLEHIPEDFLVDIVSSNNAIYMGLRNLFMTIFTTDKIEPRLRCAAERFQERLTQKFMWDFDDLDEETGDDAPVIVDV